MPKTNKQAQAVAEELPSTIRRSSAKAQRTFVKAHDSAVRTYGEGGRAHRTAYAALKHSFQKVDGRWERKDKPGPSDPRARLSAAEARKGKGETFGGVDVEGSSRQELLARARKLGIPGSSRMNKQELSKAIEKKQ